MRVSPDMMLAQSAFWTGLLYDDSALSAAEDLMKERPWSDYLQLRADVPTLAMDAPLRNRNGPPPGA